MCIQNTMINCDQQKRFFKSYIKPKYIEKNHKSESTINFRLIFSFDFISSSSSCRSSSLFVRLLLSHSFALSRYHSVSLNQDHSLSFTLSLSNSRSSKSPRPFFKSKCIYDFAFLEYILFF